MTRLLIAGVLATLLGGCQTVFDLVGVEEPLSAGESRRYDGSYQGSIEPSPGCPGEQGEKVIMIGDGVLWYAYAPDILFTVPVRRDGLLTGTSGAASFTGQITDNHLDATIQVRDCRATLSMDYIYNHS